MTYFLLPTSYFLLPTLLRDNWVELLKSRKSYELLVVNEERVKKRLRSIFVVIKLRREPAISNQRLEAEGLSEKGRQTAIKRPWMLTRRASTARGFSLGGEGWRVTWSDSR